MCDDERPCGMCIRRGMGHACYDGIRKKPKYLEEVPGTTVMDISPSIHDNNVPQIIQHKEEPQQPQLSMASSEYSTFESTIPGNITSEQSHYWGLQEMCIQSSHDPVGEYKDDGSNKPTYQQTLIPDTYLLDDLTRCDLLNQQNAKLEFAPQIAECDMHVESTSNTGGQLSFAIKSGWSNTFF
ncbi:uncharacterized protein EURHEDRAFT_545404 [Aspergillus ruber CBS 135680]|uniref:Uncharacterized protein n=1 Tax=Aspergillus ruber (strain CBS 135680) TaxID=1388766 RepID=A0A017SQZ3_ASPRC|nr:uncharacterized protein EURHEDRAFT_545404 [Aspergillus ruber CBS 135680]EYE98685.1 hypothetical protein EURHEDRAFT_545404 [Aspergillus ruber CBS 135680]